MLDLGKLPEDCTVQEVKRFLVKLRDEKSFSSSTINLRVCALKLYFRKVAKRLDLAWPEPVEGALPFQIHGSQNTTLKF